MSKMSGRLFTVGYAGWTLEQLAHQVQELHALLLDIRFSPESRQPRWRRQNLAAHFGERYVHVQALGNINYRGGDMVVSDYGAGKRVVRRYLAAGRNVILMCACARVAQCHRLYVATRLEADLGLGPTEHLQPPTDPRQQRLL
jgi:uncharacterized protein (DUF488 family)